MIYLVFLTPPHPVKNYQLTGMFMDVIEAQEMAANLSEQSPGRTYEVYKYYEGKFPGLAWACDDLIDYGKFSSSWENGRCLQ